MSPTTEQLQQLFAAFFSRDEKGKRVYSDMEVRDVVALLMIQGKINGKDIPSTLNGVMGDFAVRIGMDLSKPEAKVDMSSMIANYLKKNPLNPGLVKHVNALIGV